ncbi:MAG: hypothetical protein IJW73_08855 [Candidatus Gastranaerophilales bacterium]|nr:hypothetical protein [Candidatus Gastranaerophilales bacterium]
MKLIKKYKVREFEEIRFLNIPIWQKTYTIKNDAKYTNTALFPKSYEKKFLNKIIKTIPKKHDFVWIVRTAGLGEAYMLNFMLEELNKKYKAKNPCIVSSNAFYKEMFELYTDIPFYHIETSNWEEINFAFLKRTYKYKWKKFRVFHCTFYESMDLFDNKFVNGEGEDYPTEIRKLAGATKFAKAKQKYSNEIVEQVNEIVPYLNKDKFVYIIPEPKSVLPVSDTFWLVLCSKIREKGYDIFINTKSGVSKIGPSAPLNIGQAAYLSSLAKHIVAIRCGFLEVVSSHNIPKHVIYTPHKHNPVSASEMLRNSTLNNYPMVDKNTVFEYNTDELSETQIIDEIMKGFEDVKNTKSSDTCSFGFKKSSQ